MNSKRLRSPIGWFGGKGNMVAKLLPLILPHKIYVEVFGGGASLLFAKPPSPVEVYNDLDSGLVNFFRVLRDKEKFQEFYRKVCSTPYSREEYDYCRGTWEKCENEIERAYRWYVVARMSFGGNFGKSWGFAVTSSCRGMATTCSRWLSTVEGLPLIHERLMRVQIEHKDFRQIIQFYDTPDTFFYLDPPYVPDTRRDGRYKCEMVMEDHQDLVDLLLQLKGKAMLSGYQHQVYDSLEEAGWKRLDFETVCHVAARTRATGMLGKGAARKKQPRLESVWLSPNCVEGRGELQLF